MTRKFTNNNFVSNAIMSFALVFISLSLFAQSVNTLRINSPASVAGDYQFVLAGFGPEIANPAGGFATLIDDGTDPITDGCEAGATNVTGKVAFVDRGGCEFGTKVLNAENAGATLVVVCNNVETAPVVMPPGADGAAVTVPAGMISQQDCNLIRVAFADGDIDATVLYLCAPPVYGPEVIWGRNGGDGDFDGGLNGWTVEKPANVVPATWHWNQTGNAIGQFTNFQIGSPTQCNGAAVMNSDSLDNGMTGNLASGPCPADCIASLVSPIIDISAADPTKGFFIQFTQAYRHFFSEYEIIVDKEGEGTWLDTIQLNADAITNAAAINEVVKIPLNGYTGVQNIQFKFRYTGNYYFWIIDDVTITNESYVDMQLNANWYAVAPTWRVPASQVSEMPFLTDMFNNGNLDAQNVQVTLDILDDTNTVIHSQTEDYGVVSNYSINENQVFRSGTYTPPTTPGQYTGRYTVSAESPDPAFPNNQITTNDELFFVFEISEDQFSSVDETGTFTSEIRAISDGSIFSDPSNTNYMPIMAASTTFNVPNGEGYKIDNIKFGVLPAPTEISYGQVHVLLFRWIGDSNGDNSMGPDERILVGRNSLILDLFLPDLSVIDVPVYSVDDNGEQMDGVSVELASSDYVVVLTSEPLDATYQIDFLAADNGDGNFANGAVNMAFDSLGITNRNPLNYMDPMTTGRPDEFTSLNLGSTQFGDYGINELWIEMGISLISGTEDVNNDLLMSVYPNPASDQIYVIISLDNASDVELELITLNGQLVKTANFDNVKSSTVVLDASSLQTGTYIMNMRTEEGSKTQKIMIQK